MISLPHGVTDPLHIDEPFPTWMLWAGALVLWLLYRLYRRWREHPAEPAKPVRKLRPKAPGRGRIGNTIEDIRRRALLQKAYRTGCHELAEALREHLDVRFETGESLTSLTAIEMADRFGDTAFARFFSLLSQLQFRRREPTQSDFEGACALALDVVVDVDSGVRSGRSAS